MRLHYLCECSVRLARGRERNLNDLDLLGVTAARCRFEFDSSQQKKQDVIGSANSLQAEPPAIAGAPRTGKRMAYFL
jgi:hypothetical protein